MVYNEGKKGDPMTASELRKKTNSANNKLATSAAREKTLAEERAKQFQLDLRGKYADEFVSKLIKGAEDLAAAGRGRASLASSWQNEDGATMTAAAAEKLKSLKYVVNVIKKRVPEYQQEGPFEEGDCSHDAYDEYSVQIAW